MHNFDDKDIATLLRLKRFEQPPPGYFDNFLHEFHRRQRAELLRQPLWRIALQRVHDFMFQLNVPALSSYPAAAMAVVALAAVLSLNVYQAPQTTQNVAAVTVQQQPAALAVSNSAPDVWSLSSNPVITRDFGSSQARKSNVSSQTQRLTAPPRYVLDSAPVSYEPASFRF